MKILPGKEAVRLEINISETKSKFKDIWLLESLRLTWELWSRLGWSTVSNNILEKKSWELLQTDSKEEQIMMAIERVIKVAQSSNKYHLLKRMARIGMATEDCDLFLESSSEVDTYRKLVGQTLLEGIVEGMNTQTETPADEFKGALENVIFDRNSRQQFKDTFYTEQINDTIVGVLYIYFTCETHFEGVECFY